MNFLNACARRALMCAALVLPLAAQAEPVTFFVPYGGQGNVSVFDATAGTGGWVGAIDQTPDANLPTPLSLVSVVLFTFDAASRTLAGSFEFTTTDLLSTLYGELTGSTFEPDILLSGGQFSLDYQIRGGSGMFAGASGFGLAFLDFNPAAAFDNYRESGLLLFTVGEPATLALVASGLLIMGVSRRRPSPVN
jgi:hypothetical protein